MEGNRDESGEFLIMTEDLFVPSDFIVPTRYECPEFLLVPLGPEHNDRDFKAWKDSLDHIRRTPGFEDYDWPIDNMTLKQNLSDLETHQSEFRSRSKFAYSVLRGEEVVGCVYINPTGRPRHATVRSWVSETYAHLDKLLYEQVSSWLTEAWPFDGFDYSPRLMEPDLVNR